MMRRFGIGFAALVVALLMCASAMAQERHYIANDDHTDYFWAGTDEDYRAAFQSMLDYYMQQAEDTADHHHDHRGRFNCDGSLWVYEYENNRSQAEFERLIGHIRDGNISMPMQSLVILPGAMSTETVLRDMYYAGRLERRYDLDFDLAVAMENQTLPAGVASLWAGSGVKYSWKGVCGCVSRLNLEQVERDREIYHFAGPDGQSVVLKWNSLLVNNESLGGYAEARDPSGVVQYMSTDPTFRRVWPWPVKGAFGYGWDDISTTTDAFILAAQNMSTPQRRVIVSNETDFFEDFVANHGDELETFSGSYGNEWDLLTASLGEVTAKMRRSVEKLRTAEAMATIVALQGTDLAQDRIAERNRAFMFMGLYYDHDWTANSGIGVQFREGFQRDTLAAVEGYVDGLYNDAQSSLADMIANPDPTGVPLMVFNPLSWARTDVASMPLTLDGPVHVIDQDTGAEVPSQVDTIDGERFIVILASDVPPVGYRTYRVLPGVGDPFDDAATVDGNTVDNSLYGLTLADDGAITSIIDHCQNDRQLVADGGALGRLNAPGGGGQISVEAQGPVLVRMKVVVPGPPARETRITVYRDINRIDLDNTITQNFTSNLGYQFDLAMGDFTTRHEEVGAIATAKRIAQGGTYADSLARTDYLTLGHFANMAESGFSATLSSWDSSFMKLGNSGVDTLDTTTPSLTAVVGMQVDGPDLGIRNQGGDSRFVNRYALRTHGNYDQAGSMRFAMAHQNPFVAAPLTGGPDSPLPPELYSLLGIDSDEVLAWAIKPAEEGIEHGIIARVWNLSETPESFELRPRSVRLDAATHTTHVETDIAPITVPDGALVDTLARQQLRTYRLTVSEQIVDPPEDVGPPDAGNDVDPEPDPMPDPEPEPEPDPNPEPDPQPEPNPDPMPDVGDPNPDVSDVPDPNPEPDPQPEPEPDPMPDVGAMMDASDAPDAEPDPMPDPNPEPEPEPDVGDPEPDIDLMDAQEPDAMDAEDDVVVIEDAPMDVPEPEDIQEDIPDVIIPEDLAQSEDADICADLPSGDDPFDDPDPNPDPQPGPEPDPMPDPNPTPDTGNPDVDGSITDTGESPEPGIAPSDPGDCDCTVPGHTPDHTPWPLVLLVAIVGFKLREKTRE